MIIDLGHSRIFKREDGIVQLNCTEHNYSLDDVLSIGEAHKQLNGGIKSLLLVVVHPYTDIETSARHFLKDPASTEHSVAEAYVLRSLAQKLLANFHVKNSPPNVPTKFFSIKEEAVIWLKQFQTNSS